MNLQTETHPDPGTMANVTNTLILARLSADKLDDEAFIRSLQQVLLDSLVQTETTQFIILRKFRRIVLVFDTRETSSRLYPIFKKFADSFTVGYSLHDYNHDIDNYLQLPNNSRMFLISPPASPPVDFDYDQEEEEPNKHQIYTHEEIQEMFLKNNQELRDLLEVNHTKTKYSNNQMKRIFDFEKEIVLNDSNDPNQPKIILNPVNGENDHLIGKAIRSFKTSLPPSSAFAGLTDDQLDSDDDEEYQAYKAQLMAQQAD